MPFPYDVFGVGKRHCRLLLTGAIDYFGVGKRHCRLLLTTINWGRETALPSPPNGRLDDLAYHCGATGIDIKA